MPKDSRRRACAIVLGLCVAAAATPTTTSIPTSNPTPAASQTSQPPTPTAPEGLQPERLAQIQAALRAQQLDGWLFYDFRGSDPIAYRMLGLDASGPHTRRWYCYVPAKGAPQRLVHAIEPHAVDGVPGSVATYAAWRVRDRELGRMLRGQRRVAMQYSPRNEIPTVAKVDAGTLELVRSLGPEVVSSADLVAELESTLSPAELATQARASELIARDLDATAQEAARRIRAGNPATERELQEFARQRWAEEALSTEGSPLVQVDANSANPHYVAGASGSAAAGKNSVLLLDFSARLGSGPHAIYADLAKVYFLGERTPDEIQRIAGFVFEARDAAIALLRQRFAAGRPVTGAEVDDAARAVIAQAGYGDYFVHRTGHNIGVRGHGDGVNNDNFETRDARRHLVNSCFSIEPGIYLPGRFGIRSEVDVCLLPGGVVEVRGDPQKSVPALLAP